MPDLLPISDADMLAEVERELKMRARVYPRWISGGHLSQQSADRQMDRMIAVRDLLFKLVYKTTLSP